MKMIHWKSISSYNRDSTNIYSAANFCFNKGVWMIWNKGTLSKDKSCKKSSHDLGFHSPNRYESDLLNEILYIHVGQEATKISEVKVGGRKISARLRGPQARQSRICLSRQFSIDLQLWPLIFLQPLDLQERTVPHLKVLTNICLENECQVHGSTLNVIYVCSKYPYFISYRGLC